MSRFLVLDVVFFGGALNYDQGGSNYNELKKIKWWDGSVRVIVSKYALRYSILHYGEKFCCWKLAKGKDLEKTKEDSGKGGIHPTYEAVFDYPEFDLFGYLITKKKAKGIARSAPVKLTHAVSLTKFGFDSHFNVNLDLSKRYSESNNNAFEPAPFTTEEFMGFYVYNVTIDLDRIGKFEKHEIYDFCEEILSLLNKKNEGKNKKKELIKTIKEKCESSEPINKKIEYIMSIRDNLKEVLDKNNKEKALEGYMKNLEKINDKIKNLEIKDETIVIKEEGKKRVEDLLKIIMNLKRDVGGKNWDLSPWLVVAGYYNNEPYDTYFDKIELNQEKQFHVEAEIEEINDPQNKNKKTKTVRYKEVKSTKPKFKINGKLDEKKVLIYKRNDILIELDGLRPLEDKEEFITALINKINWNNNEKKPCEEGGNQQDG